MYILIDKINRMCYPGDDLKGVADASGKSINTLRKWAGKSNWHETIDYLLIKETRIRSRRGGINEGNKYLFVK